MTDNYGTSPAQSLFTGYQRYRGEKDKWFMPREALPARDPNARYSSVRCLVIRGGWSEREQKPFFHDSEILSFNHEHLCWDDSCGDDFICEIDDVAFWSYLPLDPRDDRRQAALQRIKELVSNTSIGT